MKVKAVFGTLTWIVVLLVVGGFVRMQCTKSYRGLRGSISDKVDHVKTVPLDEAIRKGTVAVSIIFTDNGQKANVTLTRQEGHGGFHVRITQGLHNLPSGGRTVQVRADSELTLNLATSSIATASLAVAR